MSYRIVYLLAILCMLNATVATAQQDPLYSQYMFTMLAVNPAYAGSRDVLSVTGLYRRQWIGVNGTPETQLLTADFALKNKKIGLGLQAYNDEIGIVHNTGIYASYAYRIKFERATLSMGLQAGVVRFKADFASVKLGDNQDDIAFAQNQNEFRPNFGAGIFLNTDKFYIGISAPRLVGQDRISISSQKEMFAVANHWFVTAGYVFTLSPDLKLKPSAMLRVVDGAPPQIDINANVWLHDIVSLGVSYRTRNTMVGMFELQITEQLRFGYAYDLSLSSLKSQGSHEFMLRYEFGYNRKNVLSPRHF